MPFHHVPFMSAEPSSYMLISRGEYLYSILVFSSLYCPYYLIDFLPGALESGSQRGSRRKYVLFVLDISVPRVTTLDDIRCFRMVATVDPPITWAERFYRREVQLAIGLHVR